jgi:Post-segregation antitoxin CcdA
VDASIKRATTVSLNSDLLEQAKILGINVSRACERGLAEQIAELVIAHGVGKKGCAGSRNMSERMDGEAAALPPE